MKQVTFWNGIVDLDQNEVFFHAVHGSVFSRLQEQAENGEIVLHGRVETDDDEWHERGQGQVSCSSFDGMQLSVEQFYDEDGMIFILAGENAEKFNSEEYLVSLPEWKIVGGLRPTEDSEVFNFYSMEEMVEL
jgi:hypothetical protein